MPETHLARPRIPDPALETEIVRQILEAGFTVVDSTRVAEIRDADWVRALSAGNAPQEEIDRIKREYGADILVTGEGISQRAEADRIGSGTVRCVARGEIKAYRLDNAEMIFSDAVPAEQATGIAEEIVAKNALQHAGERISPRIVNALFARAFGHSVVPDGGTTQVAGTIMQLKLNGWQQASDVGAFLRELPKIKGILSISDSAYEAGILTLKLLVKPDVVSTLGFTLADEPTLQIFHLNITTFRGTTMEGSVRKKTIR